MANFDSGVKGFVKGYCVIEVNFPIDLKGRKDISCKQCPYLSYTKRTCALNQQTVQFPEQYVGHQCPLVLKEELNESDLIKEFYDETKGQK